MAFETAKRMLMTEQDSRSDVIQLRTCVTTQTHNTTFLNIV